MLCFTLYSRANSKYKPPGGGLYSEERFNGGFFCVTISEGGGEGLYLEGLIFGILGYFYNSLNSLQSLYKIPRALLENMYPVILERGFRGNTV